ncbi:hypothetical protein HPB52_023492 [Rhipicephalus sanguineus]|uniref:AMP-binding enzyme C-terminal domain-containing protein n=1 Tax=Rhipicephalus sanguineus TaxID=34632 RepID=A0A9D4TC47_RHISA|nr:hypothetical protein HPB52_023492 [Rhipicephalus sanguineus]
MRAVRRRQCQKIPSVVETVTAGDKGYYTADGCFFLCGRFKELIKCMDQQVSPAELEELLASDPEVLHVVVAGVPHSQYGEAARAFVVHQRRLTDPLQQQKEAERLKEVVAGKAFGTFMFKNPD